jgi:DNA-binding PucR family transcriptional regulator
MSTDPLVVAEVRRLARELLPRTGEIAGPINECVLRAVPELAPSTSADAVRSLRESTEQNLGAMFSTLAFGLTPQGIEPPSGTQELLRDIVAEGGNVTHLLRAYRVGHGQLWKAWSEHVRTGCGDVDVHEVLRLSSEHLFAYIDSVCQRIVDDHAHLAAAAPDGPTDRRGRAELVRALLGPDPVDLAGASRGLRYELSRVHVGLVAAAVDRSASVRVELQRVVDQAGAPALVLPSDDGSWSAWICWAARPPEAVLRTLTATPVDGVLVGLGEPGDGRQGFRRSHGQAREAVHAGRLTGRPAPAVVRHRDVEVAAILCSDPERARRLADGHLGPLAADDETAERLRATLRTLFAHGNNRRSTATALNVHIKTVSYRISQAEQLLGRSVARDTFDLNAALLIDHTLRTGL